MKTVCISRLPSAGLGNKLFSWASGIVFSTVNNCPHYVTGLTKLHIGPILRGERKKRFYIGYFKNERRLLPLPVYFQKKKTLPQKKADQILPSGICYVFGEIPDWRDYFATLKNHRALITDAFWNSLTPKVLKRIENHPSPAIGVHIRMGDFRQLQEGEDFSKVGTVRTPFSYFVETIQSIRNFVNRELPVTIFSDGFDNELAEILCLPNTTRAKDDFDIVHLAVLSRSKLIIMSAGSTFSFWAGFLSEGILINHYQHLQEPIRGGDKNSKMYEGGLINNNFDALLQRNLNNVFSDGS